MSRIIFSMLRNGAVEKATSEKMIACLERCVDSDVDIIFSEFVHDDGFDTRVRCHYASLWLSPSHFELMRNKLNEAF